MPDVPDDASMGARVARRGIEFFITSRTLTIIGDMAALTALSVYIYTASGSATMVSGLFVVRVLPRLFGPIAGAVADRYNLRTLMVVCDLGACLLFVAIAIVQPSYWGLLAMILVAESIATIAMPGALEGWGCFGASGRRRADPGRPARGRGRVRPAAGRLARRACRHGRRRGGEHQLHRRWRGFVDWRPAGRRARSARGLRHRGVPDGLLRRVRRGRDPASRDRTGRDPGHHRHVGRERRRRRW